MSGDVTDSAARADIATWRDIDELLAATAVAAKTGGDARSFYAILVDCALRAIHGAAGGVWRLERDGSVAGIYECHLDDLSSCASIALFDEGLLSWMARQGKPVVLSPRARTAAGFVNPLDQTIISGPVLDDDDQPVAVAVLVLQPQTAASHAESTLEVFAAFCELAADYQRRDALRTLRERQRLQQSLDEFAVRIQRQIDADATAYAIVNDGRRIIGCDRLSVVTILRNQPCARAVSGSDVLERRGATLRALEALAQSVARAGEPMHLHRGEAVVAAELMEVAEAYRDASLAKRLDALPLFWPPRDEASQSPRVMAVLVLEWFTAAPVAESVQFSTISAVQRLAEAALANALTLERIPWAAGWRRIDAWCSHHAERRWIRILVPVLAGCAVIALGIFIPAELTVSARGRLQPVERRAIFAPSDGVVAEVLVDHGAQVAANQLLLRLENSTLAIEGARITGELATAEQQLRSVRAERWSDAQDRPQPDQDASQLAAQEESLVALVASLAAQQRMAAEQQSELNVGSPIAGSVVTWRVAELLRARPVARGQELLTIADETGPWLLELDVPDRQIRQVLSAQAASMANLEVSFRLSTDPSAMHVGQLRKLAGATQPRESDQLVVPVEVDFDKRNVASLRPGVEVTARIHCGRRSIAYVWLHEVWEWLAARVW